LCKYLGPDESHSVHKLRTTKIVVEEAPSSPSEISGSFSFTKMAKSSEIMRIEEVESSCAVGLQSITETVESNDDIHLSPQKSHVASHTDADDDDGTGDLFECIKKQRNALEEILKTEGTRRHNYF
jgi:hypothetical protein